MREYAKVSPSFWTGTTGRALRLKGTEAVVVGMYLMTAPGSNMLGLYYQPLLYMAHETGLGIEGASKGLADCIAAGFCRYDEATETVWVVEMAAYQIADELKVSDKRCAGIQKDYLALPENPFLGEFFDRYSGPFHFNLRRGSEGPSKPHRSKEQEQEQAKEQEKEEEKKTPPSPRPAGGGTGKVKVAKAKVAFAAFIADCVARGEKPVPADDPIFDYADDTGIPREFLQLAWREFTRKHRDSQRLQKDWRAHFRNAVRGNWAKLWWMPPEGGCSLTTQGVQAKRERDAEAARKAEQQAQPQEEAA